MFLRSFLNYLKKMTAKTFDGFVLDMFNSLLGTPLVMCDAADEVTLTNRYENQGRIHGYPSRVWVGRSRAGEGHQGIWAGAVCSKS